MAEHGERALLVDFGSTFTKLRAVDLDGGRLLGAVQAPSTVDTSIVDGLGRSVELLQRQLPGESFDGYLKLAASSAAGGLVIVAVGLVQDLTAEAAKRAALGAGGKVVATFANGLTDADLAAIGDIAPDTIVLAGGTDGGNRDCIVDNAQRLADARVPCPIIVAGNRNAADEVASILERGGRTIERVPNVLPAIDRLDVDGCTEAIRRLFMERIVQSKGLSEAESYVGKIVMPTPHAVLKGCKLLADGPGGDNGLGELMCVDIGGATTDVYSISEGAPQDGAAVRGLKEPVVKRTVEGDLGLRVNAPAIVEAVGERGFGLGDAAGVQERATSLSAHTETLPLDDEAREFDLALGRSAIGVAMRRHAGTLEIAYGPSGAFAVQTGKDLRGTSVLVGTGGIFSARPEDAPALLRDAFFDPEEPRHLLPAAPACFVDREYVLYAVGLLASMAPEAAFRLGTASLRALEGVGAGAAS